MAVILGKSATKFTLTTAIVRKALEAIREQLEKQKDRLQAALSASLREVVKKYVLKNHVIKNLTHPAQGVVGYDLPAEFGLTEADVAQGVKTIVEVLVDSVMVEVSGRPNAQAKRLVGGATIRLFDPDKYEMQLMSSLQYDSKKNYTKKSARSIQALGGESSATYPIQWGKWLLYPKKGISIISEDLPNISQYGIAYNLPGISASYSRSGRALMLRGNNKKNSQRLSLFPYDYPRGARPFLGAKNFVDEIFVNQNFQTEVVKTVFREINKAIGK